MKVVIRRVLRSLAILSVLYLGDRSYNLYKAYQVFHVQGAAIVRLVSPTDAAGGTGFQVSYKGSKFLVTNAHVCETSSNGFLIVVSPFARIQYSEIRFKSRISDLCVLTPVRELPALELGDKNLERGDKLTVLGSPKLRPLTVSEGTVTSLAPSFVEVLQGVYPKESLECQEPKHEKVPVPGTDAYFMCVNHILAQATTAIIFPGNSGSPILDKDGKVVGVAFAAANQGPDANKALIVPQQSLQSFLQEILDVRKGPTHLAQASK